MRRAELAHVTIWDGISGRGIECTGQMKAVFVKSSWWPRPCMETEKYNISTGTYCGHNCVWWRLCSVFIVLNGCCLANLLRSLSSLGVIFRDLSVLWRSFTLLVWFTRYQLKNDEPGFFKFTCTFAKLKFGGGF
jgi:hypothetical protein